MSLVQINWKASKKDLFWFGVCMIVGFGLIGGLLWWKAYRTAAIVCWVVAGVCGGLGLTRTSAALPFYWAWMSIAFVLGNIISRLVLAVFFYGMITPMGLVMRLCGRDKLTLRRRTVDTYWVDAAPPAPDKSRYERQF